MKQKETASFFSMFWEIARKTFSWKNVLNKWKQWDPSVIYTIMTKNITVSRHISDCRFINNIPRMEGLGTDATVICPAGSFQRHGAPHVIAPPVLQNYSNLLFFAHSVTPPSVCWWNAKKHFNRPPPVIRISLSCIRFTEVSIFWGRTLHPMCFFVVFLPSIQMSVWLQNTYCI